MTIKESVQLKAILEQTSEHLEEIGRVYSALMDSPRKRVERPKEIYLTARKSILLIQGELLKFMEGKNE